MFSGAFRGIKVCACGRHYTRIAWRALPLVGIQQVDEQPSADDIELRNCECGSTLGLLVSDVREVAA